MNSVNKTQCLAKKLSKLIMMLKYRGQIYYLYGNIVFCCLQRARSS